MASTPPSISTLVMGPQAGGRGYRVLARSNGPAIAGSAEARLSELALVLAGWADEREPAAIALVPLTDATAPALLLRMAYLGTAPLGTIAFAHGLIMDEAAFAACAGRPDSLLHLIPPPDGSRDFAAAPLTPDPPPPAQRHNWNGLGLEWRDRIVFVPGQAETEAALRSVLAALGPAGPGARVRGWATTALLPSSGSFSPARELQLIVLGEDQRRPDGLQHLPARATRAGFDGERVDLPPAARAWERLKSLGAVDADLALAVEPLRWSPANFNLPPADMLRLACDTVIRRLTGGAAQMRLVIELARPRSEDLDPAFAQAARGLFEQLLNREHLEPQHAAFYIRAIADGPPEAAAALGAIGPLLLKAGSGRWLRGRTFARLLDLGYAEALAARSDEAPIILRNLGAAELAALLDRVMLTRDDRLRTPLLVSAILRLLADQRSGTAPVPDWSAIYAAALQWRLAAPPAPDERQLGARSVVRTTFDVARPLMAPLAARTLRLRGRSGSARETLDMIGGALEWVRLEGATV